MQKALLIVDLQNDYFPNGKFPLWNSDVVLNNIVNLINNAKNLNLPIILIKHIADKNLGTAPFFNENTSGAKIHPQILAICPDPVIIIKQFADSFYQTNLTKVLDQLNVNELLIFGMMTQNCVTHTAISKSAEKYKVSIVSDCCTTVSEILHKIALRAIATRVSLINSDEVV